MAFRVDSEGYRLNLDGTRKETSPEDQVKFKTEIDRAWSAGHSGPIPKDQTIMIAEDNDCQWTAAEDAGADPSHTSYTMNEHFGNPDLIYKDQAIFLGKITQYKTGPEGNNTDIFTDSVNTRTANGEATGGDNKLLLDTTLYMLSVPEGERLNVLQHTLPDAAGGVPRQTIIEGYLLSFDPALRPAKAAELKAYYGNSDPVEDDHSAAILTDVNAVLTKMGLAP